MVHKNEKLFIKEHQKQDLKENENFGGNNCNKHLVYKWLLEINKKNNENPLPMMLTLGS